MITGEIIAIIMKKNVLRRKDRSISEEEAVFLLNKAEYGILSTVSGNGEPYGVPLNFCVIDNCIYFHGALEGRKIENIIFNNAVSFCVVGETKVLPDKFSTEYESVIISGKAEEVFDKEKTAALEAFLKKYSPDFMKEGMKYIIDSEKITSVVRITIKSITGKARKC